MNVLKPNLQTTVITLLNNGVSQHEIHRKTGIDRKTIRKYSPGTVDLISNSPMATGFAGVASQIPPPRPPGRGESEDSVDPGLIPYHARSACAPHR
ncbi:MAG: IS21 family transposase, partial [Bdellovibrionota bacterium]